MSPQYAQPAPMTPDMMLMLQQAIKSAPQPMQQPMQGMTREQLVNMMRGYY
jgi:hypothetical protein